MAIDLCQDEKAIKATSPGPRGIYPELIRYGSSKLFENLRKYLRGGLIEKQS